MGVKSEPFSSLGPLEDFWGLTICFFRLLFQCRYSGTAVEALVMEVNDLPPPMAVTATGPLRVELKLGNGICHSKGCREGEQHRSYRSVGLP